MTRLQILFTVMFVVGVFVSTSGFAGLMWGPKVAIAVPVMMVVLSVVLVGCAFVASYYGVRP